MNSITIASDAHVWLRWMTGRTLDFIATIPDSDFRREFPIGVGSVHSTMVHLVGAERIWIGVLEGDATVTMPLTSELTDIASIRAEFVKVRTRWDGYLQRLTPVECERVVLRVRDGIEYRQRVIDSIMQVPTHALYHNAQISFMLRSMGHALPDSSWILWARERLSKAK